MFTRARLSAAGFTGWLPFSAIRGSDCPRTGGIYVVAYAASDSPAFMEKSCGGWFKGKDPTVSPEALRANWVAGNEIVYIGKADQLRRRLVQYADFGAGKPVGHWGGRLIWQLPNPESLLVAWQATPGRTPADVERDLIAQYRSIHGKPPFANEPHRMGA